MKSTLIWAVFFGLSAIALGALGAHALKQIISPTQLQSFETGVRYQMYHALFLLVIAMLTKINILDNLNWVRNLTVAGVFCFSFSIYALSLQAAMDVKLSFLGPVTPIGGLLLIAAWVVLGFKILKEVKAD